MKLAVACAGAVILLAGLGDTRDAFAQGAAARREMVQRAQEAARAGNHTLALDLATRAAQVMPTASLHAMIATEHLALSQFAEALDAAEQCTLMANHDTAMRNRDVIVRTCTQVSTQARPKVESVVIQAPAERPSDLSIKLNGRPFNTAFLGVPYMVNPGPVKLEASAHGFITFTNEFTAQEGSSQTIAITLEPEPVVVVNPDTHGTIGSGMVGSSGPGSNGPGQVITPPATTTPPPPSGPGAGPWVLVGIGGVSLAASLAFFLVRNAQWSGLEASCSVQGDSLNCPDTPQFRAQYDGIVTFNTVSITTLAVGGVALISGLSWFFAGGGLRRAETRPTVSLTGGYDGRTTWIGLGGSL